MPVQQSQRPVSAKRLEASALDLLEVATLCSIATVTPDRGAYINTAYFARTPSLHLVWLSDPDARHSRHLAKNRTAAIAVYDPRQTWGTPDRGIQLFGAAQAATEDESRAAQAVYAARFPAVRMTEFASYRFYVFRPDRVKLFDEVEFGAGRFVIATVDDSGRLSWETTEIYLSDP